MSALVFAMLLAVISFFFKSSQPDCFIADSVTLIDEKNIDDENFRLYSIVRGWHDKVETLELYVGKVDFDSCGSSSLEPIDSEHINLGPESGPQEQWIKQVVVSKGIIQIEYSTTEVVDWSVEWQ